jgi:hypothetical protein
MLTACAAPKGETAAVFPARVGSFERVEWLPATPGRDSALAGYQSADDPGPVAATVHVHAPRGGGSLLPVLDRIDDPAQTAAADLVRSEAQVRRFYPKARVVRETEAFLYQQGAIHPGRRAQIEFEDLYDGVVQPIQLTVYTFCCDRAGMLHEYRFRYVSDPEPTLAMAVFMRALAWSDISKQGQGSALDPQGAGRPLDPIP